MKLLSVYSSRIQSIGREKPEPNSGFLQPSNHLSHFEKRYYDSEPYLKSEGLLDRCTEQSNEPENKRRAASVAYALKLFREGGVVVIVEATVSGVVPSRNQKDHDDFRLLAWAKVGLQKSASPLGRMQYAQGKAMRRAFEWFSCS